VLFTAPEKSYFERLLFNMYPRSRPLYFYVLAPFLTVLRSRTAQWSGMCVLRQTAPCDTFLGESKFQKSGERLLVSRLMNNHDPQITKERKKSKAGGARKIMASVHFYPVLNYVCSLIPVVFLVFFTSIFNTDLISASRVMLNQTHSYHSSVCHL